MYLFIRQVKHQHSISTAQERKGRNGALGNKDQLMNAGSPFLRQ